MIYRFLSVRPVRALIALCISALIACPPAYAQSDNEPDTDDRWALQFQVTDNFTLGDFQGGLISVKKQYSARRAFRIGINLNASVSRTTTERDMGSKTERDRNNQTIGINAQWMRYPIHESRLRAYWGVGPTIDFNRRAVSRETNDEPGDANESNGLVLRGGALGTLGAEWFVRPRLSLSAEYRAGLTYFYARSDQGSDVDTQHQVSLGSRGVLVGVSFYF